MPPYYNGNVIRGGVGSTFRRIVCHANCREPETCELGSVCPYTAVFQLFVPEDSEKITGGKQWVGAFRCEIAMRRRENIERESRSEHLVQEREHFLRGGVVDFTQPPYQSTCVHSADLVQDDLPAFSLKSDWNPGGVILPMGSHRRDDNGADVAVHLIGRNDQAGTGFADFTAPGGVEADEVAASIEAHLDGTSLAAVERYGAAFELAGGHAGNELWADLPGLLDASSEIVDPGTEFRDILHQIGELAAAAAASGDHLEVRAVLIVK